MSEDDVRQAVDHLIDMAKRRGTITPRTFDKTCKDYLVRPEVLASRFLSKTGVSWADYRLSAPKRQEENLDIAIKNAQERFLEGNRWWEKYKKPNGSVFTSRNRKFVFIGSKEDYQHGLTHHFVRVSTLQTIKGDWSEIHSEFHALGDILMSYDE